MYSYLLSHYDSHMSAQEQAAARQAASGLRLTVSGSAAAPVPLLHRWQQLSGQMLLERYGMTETGMILSNPYKVRGWTGGSTGSGQSKATAQSDKGSGQSKATPSAALRVLLPWASSDCLRLHVENPGVDGLTLFSLCMRGRVC
jgi:acyl-CoA synthetase (AMP-forming)/AMP-acid ligase II